MREPDPPPLVLAASDRLARALREDLNLAEREAGRSVWRTPQVKSLRQWIADSWADTWPTAQLLSETQVLALWLDAVERNRHGVISATACAREARAAEALAQDWRLPLETAPAYSDEQRAWRGWRKQVAARMRARDWLSADQLPALVAAGLREGRIVAPPRVRLAGFETGITPAEADALDALRTVCPVEDAPRPRPAAPLLRGLRCADVDAQLQLVVTTVRERLIAADPEATPPRLVIALADPEAHRATLEGLLIEQLAPGLRRLDADPAHPPWRWDAAPPLSARPFAESLLAAVALDARDNAPEAASRLLLTAWTLAPARHALAAQLDWTLRDRGWLRLAARDLAELAAPSLREPIAAFAEVVEAAPRRAPPSAWAIHFEARLAALGWPGSESLPSASFQQEQELRRALAQLAALDAQTGTVDIARARLWLRELLKHRFEPRAEHAQPVRIVSAAEAAGIACELLIVIDADAAHFPGPARGTPFLPIETLREAGVPQATPSHWLAHRRQQAQALLAGAREALLLIPGVDARGAEVMPSPLFELSWTHAEPPQREALTVAASRLERPPCDPVPPVAAPEAPRGSTRLFEAYAQAPFLAFVTGRLGVHEPRALPRGLPASTQGQIVHGALAALWERLRDRTGLRALDAPHREQAIREALAVQLRRKLPASHFGDTLVRLETERLVEVLDRWLQLEAAREEAFAVVGHERRIEATLAGLPLSLRIDRIEDAPDGTRTLVDYKTGAQVDAGGWREDRLRAPQLPLYAVLLDEPAIADIAFGHVADGEPKLLRWQTWSSQPTLRDKPAHARDFPAQREAWRRALTAMAAGFMAGEAGFDPALLTQRNASPLLLLAGAPASEDGDGNDGGASE